jgi:hypothetical protein
MSRPTRIALALCLLGPLVLLWPLPVVWPEALLTAPSGEGVRHVWGWFAAMHAGQPFGGETALIGFPAGVDSPLIDPVHALPYALGAALGGPGLGIGLVLWIGVAVSGLAGLMLTREAGVAGWGQVVGAAVGVACPTVMAVAVDGITEGLGAGWVGLQLALLLSLRRDARWPRVLLLALVLVVAVHSGPYNAVWCAILDGVVGIALLAHTRRHLVGGALALLASAPFAVLSLSQTADQPGAAALAQPQPPPNTAVWRGAWREGADLLDLFLPATLTGHAPLATTAYLGLSVLVLAGVGVWRWRQEGGRPWPWVVGAVAFAALALGPWLSFGGELVEVGGYRLVMPAGWLERLPPLDRLSRWYRAGAVAALLLAPLVARAVRGPGALVAAVVVLLDLRLLAPIPAVLPVTTLPQDSALVGLSGPLVELPPLHPLDHPELIADENLLLQLFHGQATGRPRDDVAAGRSQSPGSRQLRRAWNQPPGRDAVAMARSGAKLLGEEGFQLVVVYPARLPGAGRATFEAAFGAPVAEDGTVIAWGLALAPR